MAKEILKCIFCNQYTLKKIHCNENTQTIKPAKFSPKDKWGRYRRIAKTKGNQNGTI